MTQGNGLTDSSPKDFADAYEHSEEKQSLPTHVEMDKMRFRMFDNRIKRVEKLAWGIVSLLISGFGSVLAAIL